MEVVTVNVTAREARFRVGIGGVDVSAFEDALRNNGSATIPLVLGDSVVGGVPVPLALAYPPALGLSLEAGEGGGAIRARSYVIEGVEQCFRGIGVLSEADACRLLNVTEEELMGGVVPMGFRASFFDEHWLSGPRVEMDEAQFLVYNATVWGYVEGRGLEGRLTPLWRRSASASRVSTPAEERGFLILVYRPLRVLGEGPLKSVHVRNYAWVGVSYTLRTYELTMAAGAPGYYRELFAGYTVESRTVAVGGGRDCAAVAASYQATERRAYRVRLHYGDRLVAEAEFELEPETSPFWRGFWDAVREKLPGILITSSIIIVTSALAGGGTAATYAGLAISIAATLYHLIAGSYADLEAIRRASDIVAYLVGQANFYGNLSYRLSNYTPPSPAPGPGYGPPRAYEPFEPKGPLAEVFWEESKSYRMAALRVVADTGLDMILQVGLSDFEMAFNPNAE